MTPKLIATIFTAQTRLKMASMQAHKIP